MPLTPIRPLASLSMLMALGAVAAPPERGPGPPDQTLPHKPKHQHRLPPQKPPAKPAHPMSHPHDQMPKHRTGSDAPMGTHFHIVQRQAVQAYFALPEHQGYVPPGLAKKGGVPPGQARLWQRGQALPAGVVWYALPRSLELVLGPPPVGHRYVRVATDILLIAIGTGIVVDAMEDLVR